jgi:hypothetical protein
LTKRQIISFDCDGVLTGGGYVDPADRTNKFYSKLEPQEDAIASIHWLSTMFDIYVVSQRSHENSNLGLRAWLHWVLGLELDSIAGVITGPSGGAAEGVYMDKSLIVRALGCVVHFDDNPHHLVDCPVGVLFPSDMPDSQAAINVFPTVQGWAGVREFLTTPGLTLHGRGDEGVPERTITSPCVAAPVLLDKVPVIQ